MPEFTTTEKIVNTSDVLNTAVRNAITSVAPTGVGTYGRAELVPDGYTLTITDEREWSDSVERTYDGTDESFSDVESFAGFWSLYFNSQTVLFGSEINPLRPDRPLLTAVFDYLETDAGVPGRREIQARLELLQTEAAHRWLSGAIGRTITQDQFLALVVDGIGEIADPTAASLHELISDLHSIRTTDVQSLITTSGASKIVLAENAKLHDGTGSEVVFPPMLTIVLTPYTASPAPIELAVRIRPIINSNRVTFSLTCAHLGATLMEHGRAIAAEFTAMSDATVLWRP